MFQQLTDGGTYIHIADLLTDDDVTGSAKTDACVRVAGTVVARFTGPGVGYVAMVVFD